MEHQTFSGCKIWFCTLLFLLKQHCKACIYFALVLPGASLDFELSVFSRVNLLIFSVCIENISHMFVKVLIESHTSKTSVRLVYLYLRWYFKKIKILQILKNIVHAGKFIRHARFIWQPVNMMYLSKRPKEVFYSPTLPWYWTRIRSTALHSYSKQSP